MTRLTKIIVYVVAKALILAAVVTSTAQQAHADFDALKASTFTLNVFDLAVKDARVPSIARVSDAATQRYRVSDGAKLTADNASGERVSIVVQDGASVKRI